MYKVLMFVTLLFHKGFCLKCLTSSTDLTKVTHKVQDCDDFFRDILQIERKVLSNVEMQCFTLLIVNNFTEEKNFRTGCMPRNRCDFIQNQFKDTFLNVTCIPCDGEMCNDNEVFGYSRCDKKVISLVIFIFSIISFLMNGIINKRL